MDKDRLREEITKVINAPCSESDNDELCFHDDRICPDLIDAILSLILKQRKEAAKRVEDAVVNSRNKTDSAYLMTVAARQAASQEGEVLSTGQVNVELHETPCRFKCGRLQKDCWETCKRE